MKIRKSTFFRKVKSEFGPFEILADEGCEVSVFIDYISKLLVVRESTDEQRKSGKPYLPKMHILNPKNGDLISREEYEMYFDYSATTQRSEDGKWEIIVQRKIDQNGIDYIEERIKNLETNEELKPAKGVAFRQSKYESWIDRYHEEIERRKKLESKLTLDQHYAKCLDNLKPNDLIYKYCSKNKVYKLVFQENQFHLFTKDEMMNRDLNWDTVSQKKATYNLVDDFWKDLTSDPNWLETYQTVPFNFGTDKLIAKSIIQYHNDLVKGEFETSKYKLFHKWKNGVFTDTIKRSEYKQYCSNCKKLVFHNARYPKFICDDCTELITDKEGRRIEFYNTELLGHGCQGYYIGTEQKEKYDSNIGYLYNKEVFAEEAHFGGIVIQLKE